MSSYRLQRRLLLAMLIVSSGIGVVLAAFQFVPGPRRDNPPVNPVRTIQANTQMPPHVASLLARSCNNCHSHETKWPWYSYVAPVSWRIVQDVHKARKVLNFSEWSVQAGRKPELAASMLAAACSDMRIGRMPDFGYSFLHRKAQLSPDDVEGFCHWSAQEGKRLIALKRAARKAAQPILTRE